MIKINNEKTEKMCRKGLGFHHESNTLNNKYIYEDANKSESIKNKDIVCTISDNIVEIDSIDIEKSNINEKNSPSNIIDNKIDTLNEEIKENETEIERYDAINTQDDNTTNIDSNVDNLMIEKHVFNEQNTIECNNDIIAEIASVSNQTEVFSNSIADNSVLNIPSNIPTEPIKTSDIDLIEVDTYLKIDDKKLNVNEHIFSKRHTVSKKSNITNIFKSYTFTNKNKRECLDIG